MNPIEQFRAAIQAEGIKPPDRIIPDARPHRFSGNGKYDDVSAWYIFCDAGSHVASISVSGIGVPYGSFGDSRGVVSEDWHADIGRPLSYEENSNHRDRVFEMMNQRRFDMSLLKNR